MSEENNQTTFFKLGGGYTITRINSMECSLIFRNAEDNVLAVMLGCGNKINAVNPYRDYQLTPEEKAILHRFIRRQDISLNNEAAAALDLSVLHYADGREEYISEQGLKNRLREPLDGVSLFVGKLHLHTLNIAAYSRGGVYNLSRARIKKLTVGSNCDLLIDLRDNENIEAVRVGESYNGGINLSRSTVESIVIADNCRCDLAVFDSRRCFTLNIADVYSGNLNIKNSCLHNLNIGYYSYAVIRLTDNWCRREIALGDSFRGSLYLEGVNADILRLGKDCKGLVKVSRSGRNPDGRRIEIGDDFAGVLDLRGSESVKELQAGLRASGQFNLWGAAGIREVGFGRYFSGTADFSESAIEYINVAGGSSGELVLRGCDNLKMLKLPQHKNSALTIERQPLRVRNDDNFVYYHFVDDGREFGCPPLYQKICSGVREMFSFRG